MNKNDSVEVVNRVIIIIPIWANEAVWVVSILCSSNRHWCVSPARVRNVILIICSTEDKRNFKIKLKLKYNDTNQQIRTIHLKVVENISGVSVDFHYCDRWFLTIITVSEWVSEWVSNVITSFDGEVPVGKRDRWVNRAHGGLEGVCEGEVMSEKPFKHIR